MLQWMWGAQLILLLLPATGANSHQRFWNPEIWWWSLQLDWKSANKLFWVEKKQTKNIGLLFPRKETEYGGVNFFSLGQSLLLTCDCFDGCELWKRIRSYEGNRKKKGEEERKKNPTQPSTLEQFCLGWQGFLHAPSLWSSLREHEII